LKIPVYFIQIYRFCPLKVYLEAGLGLKSKKTKESEIGRIAHKIYLDLSITLGKGEDIEKKLHQILEEHNDPEISDLANKLLEFRLKTPLEGLPVIVELELESTELGVTGRVDLVEGLIPIEVKYKDRAYRADVEQLAAYALLLEEKLGVEVKLGCIDLLKSNRRIKVPLTLLLKKHVKNLIVEVARASLSPQYPANPPCHKCDLKTECHMLMPGF